MGSDLGYVYFAACGKKAVKIGWTKNVDRRLAELQCGNPEPLALIHAMEGDQAMERRIHRVLRKARLTERGEWFEREAVWGYLAGLGAFRSKRRSMDSTNPVVVRHAA